MYKTLGSTATSIKLAASVKAIMEAACASETSVKIYQTACRNNSGDMQLWLRQCNKGKELFLVVIY
jgi:hypothetical protein